MKPLPYNYRPYLKGAALVVFIATPGSLLLMPLVAWWVAQRSKNRVQRPRISGLRFSMNAVRPSV